MKRNNGMHRSVNMKHRFLRFACGLSVGLLSLSSGMTQAAPGSLSQLPLFLTSPVQPNIFFLLDDSGSMDWEVLKTVGALAVYARVITQWPMTRTPNTPHGMVSMQRATHSRINR